MDEVKFVWSGSVIEYRYVLRYSQIIGLLYYKDYYEMLPKTQGAIQYRLIIIISLLHESANGSIMKVFFYYNMLISTISMV